MVSVTRIVKQAKQPRGGYLPISTFDEIQFNDNNELKEENIHSSLVGLVVDYLTRFMLNKNLENSFRISIMGSMIAKDEEYASNLLNNIKGTDDKSIESACKLVGYDVFVRAGGIGYNDIRTINPDKDTIENIKIMIKRCLSFYKEYGPIIKDGFSFEGGYTSIIDRGDGDFLTKDTLWDFKVIKNKPKSSHTLQLLVYYIMGIHSIYNEFSSIKKLGIYNPRLNTAYLIQIANINKNIIDEVSNKIIGYNDKSVNFELSQRVKFNINDINELPMTEIMKELNCSRYMVMKYYSKKGLPLYKKSNKYYINRNDLYEWIEGIRKEQLMIMVIAIIFIAIFLLVAFSIF